MKIFSFFFREAKNNADACYVRPLEFGTGRVKRSGQVPAASHGEPLARRPLVCEKSARRASVCEKRSCRSNVDAEPARRMMPCEQTSRNAADELDSLMAESFSYLVGLNVAEREFYSKR